MTGWVGEGDFHLAVCLIIQLQFTLESYTPGSNNKSLRLSTYLKLSSSMPNYVRLLDTVHPPESHALLHSAITDCTALRPHPSARTNIPPPTTCSLTTKPRQFSRYPKLQLSLGLLKTPTESQTRTPPPPRNRNHDVHNRHPY